MTGDRDGLHFSSWSAIYHFSSCVSFAPSLIGIAVQLPFMLVLVVACTAGHLSDAGGFMIKLSEHVSVQDLLNIISLLRRYAISRIALQM